MGVVTAVYERGVLRPLIPLQIPENVRVRIEIVEQLPPSPSEDDRRRARRALQEAGIIRPRHEEPFPRRVSDAQLERAADILAQAGPLSELVIEERKKR